MEYKYDSRKNCASPMKRTHNFFSAAHFAMPLPTVPCNLSPVPWIHTFSSKEKDTETGYSFFGARYYSPDLSIWLSVDPMSDKYPSLSPYVYCANNPIKLMDPNGEEIGDYFSMSGEYLGTDGNCDDKVYFVSDESDIDKIKQNNKAGKTTDTENVNIKITTTKCDIWASEDVYRRTKKNGGYCEEATSVFPNGIIKDYDKGEDVRETEQNKAYIVLPKDYQNDGSGTLIHSHPIRKVRVKNGYPIIYPVTTKLDDDDKFASSQNASFIIVGKASPNEYGYRKPSAYFFKSEKFIGHVSMSAIRKINKYYSGR